MQKQMHLPIVKWAALANSLLFAHCAASGCPVHCSALQFAMSVLTKKISDICMCGPRKRSFADPAIRQIPAFAMAFKDN
jgi:hypothetical protein